MASTRRRRARAALSAIIAAGLAAAAGCGSDGGSKVNTASSGQADFERVVKAVLPSVVQIDAGNSTGSGVVFDGKDDIVTNSHVVGHEKNLEVIASPSARPLAARLVGVFAPDDIAVIRVSHGHGTLRPVRWADSGHAQVGQIVLAMGSPFGLIDSVTQGIISATGRTITGPSKRGSPPAVITDALQTSAPINPGNSGGALVTLSGTVLGIPTLTARDPELGGAADGIGFAIPSNTVRQIATQLIDSGHVSVSDRASLQIVGRTDSAGATVGSGVSVEAVRQRSTTSAAGIRAGDVIVGINGDKIENVGELDSLLTGYRPGDKVTVDVLRDGHDKHVTVRLGSLRTGHS